VSNPVAEVFDVFFNGRRAPKSAAEKPAVNWPELIRRKTCHVLIAGKTYRVSVEPVKLTEKKS